MKMKALSLAALSAVLVMAPLTQASAHGRDNGHGRGRDYGHHYQSRNDSGRNLGIFALGAFTGAALFSGPRTQVAYVEQRPVYYQPQPVYYQPQPVYYQPAPVYVAPRPVYYRAYY